MSYELTEEDHARMEREDERREFPIRNRVCEDCGRVLYSTGHDCPALKPDLR